MRILKLFYTKYRELINYCIVGGLTTVVSMLLFYGSVWTVLDGNDALQLQIANIISWSGAVVFAYVTNRKFVFESKNENIIKEMTAFVSSRILTLLLDMAVMFILATLLSVDYNLTKIVSMILTTIGNYVISKLFVFKTEES